MAARFSLIKTNVSIEATSQQFLRSKSERRARSRFTLIELLVVVAVIAILAAILLPAMNKAKARSLEVACAANLSQCVQALTLYADDMEGNLPPAISESGQTGIHAAAYLYTSEDWDLRSFVRPYIGDFRAWRCEVHANVPIDDPGNTRFACYGSFSYFPGRVRYPNFGKATEAMPTQLHQLAGDSSTYVMMQDRFNKSSVGGWFMTHAEGELVRGGPDNLSSAGMRTVLPNSGNANLAFYDGHVRRYLFQETENVGRSMNSADSNQYSVKPDW